MSSSVQFGCTVAIFARAPIAGQCKTRLIPRLGAEGAAKLQQAFISRAIETAIAAAIGSVELWCSPDSSQTFFSECAGRFEITLRDQNGADLGARMHHAFETSHLPMVLLGTDSPCITAMDLKEAALALDDGTEAVFLPAEDGGYGLVGLSEANEAIFSDTKWSTPDVMNETRRRLSQAQYDWRELRTIWDVDKPADFDRLLQSGLLPAAKALA